tara:strand:- start:799 stop:2898 length:2100 start_codon:yes stop_codon:yes gene_type:complete
MWEQLLKVDSHWPRSHIDWVELLTSNVQGFITTGKALIDKPNQANLDGFKTVLRDYTSHNWISEIEPTFDLEFPDLDFDEEEEKRDLMEDNYRRIHEAFEEHIGEHSIFVTSGAEGGKIGGPISGEIHAKKFKLLASHFSEAAKRLEAEQEVDWEELEAEVSELYPSDRLRALKEFRRELSDKVNRVIAANIPEDSDLPKLKLMYKGFEAVEGDTTNYEVVTITPELAVVFLEKVQEPKKLEGEGAVKDRGTAMAEMHQRQMPTMQARQRAGRTAKTSTQQLRIDKLKKLQTKGSSYNRFTPTFKGLLVHDLNDSELGLTQRITSDLEERSINLDAIVERVLDALWHLYNKRGTKEEHEKQLGISLPDIESDVPFEEDDEEGFREYMKNLIIDDSNTVNQLTTTYKKKLSQYRQGVSKLFKDFIIKLLMDKGDLKDKVNAIWKDGHAELTSFASGTGSGNAGFNVVTQLLSKDKGMIPIYSLPNNKKIKEMYQYMIKDLSYPEKMSDVRRDAWDELINEYFDFAYSPENREWMDVELFGDLISTSDNDDVKFSDPFRNAIAELFIEVQNGNTKLSELTGKHTPTMARSVSIMDLIREIRHAEKTIFGSSTINAELDDDKATAKALMGEIDDSEFKRLVDTFYKVFDQTVTRIRNEVVKLVQAHLETMVKNQAEYLQYNTAIFSVLSIGGGLGKALIRRS